MTFEQIANPTGKGAESFRVDSLALDPTGTRVAGVTLDFGCFFDAKTGEQGAKWREPAAFDHVLFRDDGTLIVVGQALVTVSPEGKRTKLSKKKIFRGYDPPYEAVIVGDQIVALHGWETKSGDYAYGVFGAELGEGTKRWEIKKTELHGLVALRGEVFAARGNEWVRIDLEDGKIMVVAELPAPVRAATTDGTSIWISEQNGLAVHRIDRDGAVQASVRWDDPAPLEGKRAPGVAQMCVWGEKLAMRVCNTRPTTDLHFTTWSLETLDAQSLEGREVLPYAEACVKHGWEDWTQLDAMAVVGEDLWLGNPHGVLRLRG